VSAATLVRMLTDRTCFAPPAASVTAALDLAALHVQSVSERLSGVTATLRRLAAATDWQTPAARAFFELAERLAEDAAALGPLAAAVKAEIAHARVRAAVQNSWDC
jgi:hypothetical protein